MNLYNFIVANWDSILLAVILLTAFGYLLYKGEKGIVFKMLYALVTEAEKDFGGGTGQLKLASVIASVYPKLPKLLKTFISAKTLEAWVDKVLEEAKETWKNNAKLKEYINETRE